MSQPRKSLRQAKRGQLSRLALEVLEPRVMLNADLPLNQPDPDFYPDTYSDNMLVPIAASETPVIGFEVDPGSTVAAGATITVNLIANIDCSGFSISAAASNIVAASFSEPATGGTVLEGPYVDFGHENIAPAGLLFDTFSAYFVPAAAAGTTILSFNFGIPGDWDGSPIVIAPLAEGSSFTDYLGDTYAAEMSYGMLGASGQVEITGVSIEIPPAETIDLAPSTFAIVGASAVNWGDSVNLNANVINNGNTAAGAFTVKILLSQDETVDGGDTEVGSYAVTSLAAGATSNHNLDVDMPASGTDGTYHLIMAVDSANTVTESNEANNTQTVSLSISTATPPAETIDLAPSTFAIVGTSTVNWGDSVNLNANVINNGNTAAGAFTVKILLSQDETVDGGDTQMASYNVTSLAAGATSNHNLNVDLPASGTDGSYHLIMAVDSANVIAETNEANNTQTDSINISTFVPPPSEPELYPYVFEMVTAGPFNWGDTINLNADVKNSGSAAAGAFTVKILLSQDETAGAGDTELASYNVTSLAAGATSNHNLGFSLPASGTDGTYHLIMAVDSANTVTESNEANNTQTVSLNISTVTEPPAETIDLSPNTFAIVGASTVNWGDTVNLNAHVINNGNTAAGAFTVKILLSQDETVDGGDTQMASYNVTSLAAGATSNHNLEVDMPASGTDGTYHLIMAVDSANTVAESNETNNTQTLSLSISTVTEPPAETIDLSPNTFAIVGASTVNWGDTVNLNAHVINNGNTAAGAFTVKILLSQDETAGAGDTQMASYNVTSLAAGATSNHNLEVDLPASGTDGTYHLIMAVDSANVVTETNEANNTQTVALDVSTYVPPISIEGLAAGESFSFAEADGDIIWIQMGKSGQARLTFNGTTPNGSNISGIEITGSSKSGSLIVTVTHTAGDGLAQIGDVTISGSDFGSFQATGDVANLHIDGMIKKVQIDGELGDFAAEGTVAMFIAGGLNGEVQAESINVMTINGNIINTSINVIIVKKMEVTGSITNCQINATGDKGQLATLYVGGNANGLEITADTIKTINVGGNLSGRIEAAGDKGQINQVTAGGNLTADLIATMAIKKVTAAGNIMAEEIIVAGTGKGALGLLQAGGEIDVANLDIDGAIKNIMAGSEESIGNLSGSIHADGIIKSVKVFGDIYGAIAAYGKLNLVEAMGDLGAAASIVSEGSDINKVLIHGRVFGQISADGGAGQVKRMLRDKITLTFFDPDTVLADEPVDHLAVANINKIRWIWV